MYDVLSEYYLVIKSLHIIAIISWMAALLYLPRLYVYHSGVAAGSGAASQFIVMERRLVKAIMTPAMILTFTFGLTLMLVPGMLESPVGWLHVKLLLVLLMAGLHGFLISCLRKFAAGNYPYSSTFFRYLNEVPAVLMIIIVFLVVLKPF